jgi:phytoene synthase
MSDALAPSSAPPAAPIAHAREVIARHGKTFALASRLLPPELRDDAVVLYAYCRRVDDAIDGVGSEQQPHALARLHAELDEVYGPGTPSDLALGVLQVLTRERGIPRQYLEELLAGMAMDVHGARYSTLQDLLVYAYRVAGVVGLTMCHVMGVRRPEALEHAAHLGIAMQLTNIARDVAEDWQRGRLYLPDALLARHGVHGLREQLGGPLPAHAASGVARAVTDLLALADRHYHSGEAGLPDLSPRCALAVDAARLIYADIGRVLRARGCDPRAGRAVVGTRRKLWLLVRACGRALLRLPHAWSTTSVAAPARTLPRESALGPSASGGAA